MKLAVVDNVNGTFKIQSEWTDNEKGARVAFLDRAKVLENADDVVKATIKVLDDQLDCYADLMYLVSHPVVDEEEEVEEPAEE